MSNPGRYFPLVILSLMALLFSPAATARDNKTTWKVPVFYVTDRQQQNNTFGARRIFENDTVSGMHSGIVEICIEENGNTKDATWQKKPVRQSVKSIETPKLIEFPGQSVTDLNDKFDSALVDAINQSEKKEIFVFVHGFNNSFNVAAANAAQLAFHTGCPVILYSWPSAAKLYRYSVDECNNEWSQEHFNQFLEHLLQFKQAQNLNLNIVAHSMGNRLFVRAVPVFSGKGIFKDIYMVNPDFDAQTFIHYLSRFMPSAGIVSGVHAQLLISRKDNALSAAEALFGGYTRLGQGVDSTLSAITSPQLFKNIWSHPNSAQNKSTHQQNADPAIVASIQKAFRIFDVTALDHGAIGHKVPHEFIAWMHNRDQAPPGFEIKMEKSKGGNRLTRYFSRKLKEDVTNPAGDIGIVVKSNPNKDMAHTHGGI